MLWAFQMPVWALIIFIGYLASVQPFWKHRNFLAYAAREPTLKTLATAQIPSRR
jgi:hypothetical protein